MEQFYQLAREINAERCKERTEQYEERELNGENIYTNFSLWCSVYSPKGRESPKVFAEYLKCEKVALTFVQRKHLAEKYFGYKFTYNHENQEWEIKKQWKEKSC